MARHNRTTQAKASRQRQRIAVDAARLMRESGIDDADSARHRAAHRLGVHDPRDMPAAEEVLAALRSEQQLFAGDAHARHLRHLREAACDAMGFFSRRSEEHTSELQSLMRNSYAVFCLKQKNTRQT